MGVRDRGGCFPDRSCDLRAVCGKTRRRALRGAAGASSLDAARIPERIPRHSFGARFFHAIMALSMFALLLTAFLPKVGVEFAWVKWHWIAGIVLTISVLYHIIHASFCWTSGPSGRTTRTARTRGIESSSLWGSPLPSRRSSPSTLENKVYHMIVMLAGLAAIGTGLFMMKRVRTPFFTRNPYVFSDMTWGWMYVLHGLAGVGFVALVTAHIYFAVRPEKLFITRSMIFGWISRENYLEHHDPQRWVVAAEVPVSGRTESKKAPA